MRKMSQIIFLLPLCLVALSVSSAQIPNAGFENWAAGVPTDWITDNVPLTLTPITQSNDAHSGTSSMQGTTVSYLTVNYAPTASADFPISARYSSFNGWYKFSPLGGDSLELHAIFYKSSSPIAYAQLITGAGVSSYTQFTLPMTYISLDVPDNAMIEFLIYSPGSNANVGSTFKIDDLTFGPATGVQGSSTIIPAVFALSQNYPNPFNPSTKITYQIPTDGMVRLEIYNILGKTMATLVNEQKPAGKFAVTFDGSQFTSGIYFYRIDVIARGGKAYSQTNKMILMK
jgi:hypothetical protein